MNTRRSASGGSYPVLAERLEARALLAGDFAFVGLMTTGEGPATLEWGEGVLNPDGSVTGSLMYAAFGQAAATGSLPFDHATLGPGGIMTVTAAEGEPAITGQAGANPFSSQGYGLGFLSTEYATLLGTGRTDLWMIEKPTALAADWERSYQFSAVRITASGMDVVPGGFGFILDSQQRPTAVSWSVGGQAAVEKDIASLSDDGKIVLDTGEVIFIAVNADDPSHNTVALVADLDSSDGQILAGIGGAGTTFNLDNSSQFVRGLYRGLAVSEDAGAEFFGAGTSGASAFVLDLRHDGTFSLYDARAYDLGGRDAVTSGTWRVALTSEFPTYALNRVLLTDGATGNIAVFSLQEDFTLTGESVRDSGGAVLARLAMGARAFLPLNVETLAKTVTVTLDDTGRPILYHHSYPEGGGFPDVWYSLDLIARAGGKPLTNVEIQELDASTSTYVVAGVATDGHVVTWERDVRGQWLFRDLTDEFAGEGAAPIAGDVAIYRGVRLSHFRLFVAGTDSSGDLVSYEPVGAVNSYGVEKWTFTNVTEDELAPFGESTPVWQPGTVIGFGTNWGALNVAGLNGVGQIVAAWTAPGLDRWYVNNLTDIANGSPLAGNLMAYVTDWNAIHINGLTPDGRLIVTWWAPATGGTWYTNDLTTEFGGPALPSTLAGGAPNSLVFFEGLGETLNVAAIDSSGDTIVYWWHPGAPGWMVGNLTAAIPDADRPARLVRAETYMAVNVNGDFSTQQTVFGLDEDGGLVRLYWDDHLPDQWRFEDIAGTATELPA